MKLSILVSLVLSSACGFAFSLNSSSNSNFKGWSNPNIQFVINSSNCPSGIDVAGTINGALAIWNNLATSNVNLSVVGTTTSTTYTNPITIYCESNYSTVLGSSTAADTSPGAASIHPSGDNISTGILILNASTGKANIGNYNSTTLAIVLAHEIGHLMGLGHSQDIDALMYYDASLKKSLSLAQDDIDGASYLYPRNELGSDKQLGCSTVQEVPPPSNGTKLLLTLFLLAPLGLAVHLRRRVAGIPQGR
jgi:hypothetical protein